MAGFEALPEATDPLAQPQPEDLAFFDETLEDDAALGLVLRDTEMAERFYLSKNIPTFVDMADDLIRAYVKPKTWPGTDVARANLGMFVGLEAMERILPSLQSALFTNRKYPFVCEASGQTKPEAAQANEHLLAWALKQSDFREQMRLSLKTCLQYGLVVGKWGWSECDIRKKVYDFDADGRISGVVKTIKVTKPIYECLDIRRVLVDPGCAVQNVNDERRGAKYIVLQNMVDANILDDLRDNPDYQNVPSRDELRMILAHTYEPAVDSLSGSRTNAWRDLQAERKDTPSSSDPLLQPLEILEYWSRDRVISVLQRKIVIRNSVNEFAKLPFVSCAFVDVLNSLMGFGIPRLVAAEQRFQTGVVNNWIDGLALRLNPAFQLLKGLGPGAQQIRIAPGKVITETGELKPLVVPEITAEAMNAIENSEMRASRRIGSNTASDAPTGVMRTGTGVNAFQGDVTMRLQYFLEQFIDLVFVPVLENFLELMHDHLEHEEVNEILTDAQGKAYVGDVRDVYNATVSIDVLAGTKLSQKVALGQLIPVLIQLVSSQPVQDSFQIQGMKFNYAELVTQAIDYMGLEIDSLILPMTQDDMARAQQMNAGVVKAQMEQAKQAQQHQNDIELVNEKGTVQAGVAITKQIAKTHMDAAMQELTGGNGQ